MDANEVRKQLSYFLGLGMRAMAMAVITDTAYGCPLHADDETIDQQIVPMLANLKSRAELQEQLTVLLNLDAAVLAFVH